MMPEKAFLKVVMCPFCGSEGCMGTWFDPLTEKWSTDFHCDADESHHCFIVRLPPTDYEDWPAKVQSSSRTEAK